MKTCNICKITRELTEFTSNGHNKNGTKTYKPFCKHCRKVIMKNYLNDVTIIVRGKPVAIPSPTRKAKNEYQRKYREKNKETLQEKAREYYKKVYSDEEKKKAILDRQRKARNKRIAKQKLEMIKQKRLLLNENIC